MSYMVCEGSSVAKLREEVDHYLRKGWKLQGGIAVACSPTTAVWWFYQAIVLNSSEAKLPREEELA